MVHMISILNERPAFFDNILPDLFGKMLYVIQTSASMAYEAHPDHPFHTNPQTPSSDQPPMSESDRTSLLDVRNSSIEFLSTLFDTHKSELLKVKYADKQSAAAFLEVLARIMMTFKPSPTWETDGDTDVCIHLLIRSFVHLFIFLFHSILSLLTPIGR